MVSKRPKASFPVVTATESWSAAHDFPALGAPAITISPTGIRPRTPPLLGDVQRKQLGCGEGYWWRRFHHALPAGISQTSGCGGSGTHCSAPPGSALSLLCPEAR